MWMNITGVELVRGELMLLWLLQTYLDGRVHLFLFLCFSCLIVGGVERYFKSLYSLKN